MIFEVLALPSLAPDYVKNCATSLIPLQTITLRRDYVAKLVFRNASSNEACQRFYVPTLHERLLLRCTYNVYAGHVPAPDTRVPPNLWGAGVHFWVPQACCREPAYQLSSTV
eukprot:4527530-Amphidinium_carterae.3